MNQSILKLSDGRLQSLYIGHPCDGNTPDNSCFICNEMARRNLLPSAEEVRDTELLAEEMGAPIHNYN